MRLTEEGVSLIKSSEAWRSEPYMDGGGVATIGYGFTHYPDGSKVSMKDKPLTTAQGMNIFNQLIGKFTSQITPLIKVILTDNQFSAVVDLAYNIGVGAFKNSTLLKKINVNPNDPTIRAEFLRWNKDNGKEIQGLTNRRVKEANLYFR